MDIRVRIALSMLGLVGLLSCGGRVIEDQGQDPSAAGSRPTKGAPSGTAPGTPGKGGTGDALPSKALGKCVAGFDRSQNPTLPCRWLTQSGMCFDDTDSACACICPTDRDSVCAHGFDKGPDSA